VSASANVTSSAKDSSAALNVTVNVWGDETANASGAAATVSGEVSALSWIAERIVLGLAPAILLIHLQVQGAQVEALVALVVLRLEPQVVLICPVAL